MRKTETEHAKEYRAPPGVADKKNGRAIDASTRHDAEWRVLTERANAAFDSADYGRAAPEYLAAIVEAERVLDGVSLSGGAPPEQAAPMLIVSSLNKARNHQALGDLNAAEITLEAAAKRLVAIIKDDGQPFDLRRLCATHLPHLMNGYREIVAAANISDARLRRSFADAADAALAFWNGSSASA